MSIFNEDLSTIRNQINNMGDIFAQAVSKEDYYRAYISYKTLCDIYKELSGNDIYDLSGSMKIASYLVADSFRKEYLDKFFEDFYHNKNLSQEMFKEAFISGERRYNSFLLGHKTTKKKDILSEPESAAIIYSFLEEKFPEDLNLFEKMIKEKKIYYQGSEKDKQNGNFYYYDIYTDTGSIYLTKPFTSIETLADFINQFGHIVDCKNLSNKSSPNIVLPVSNTLRFDSKYISTCYKYAFLKFLIENNIHKEDAQEELSKMFKRGFKYLEDGYLASMGDEGLFREMKFGSLTKGELVRRLNSTSARPIFCYDNYTDEDYLIRLPKISSVSYGTCLALLTDRKEQYKNFVYEQDKTQDFKTQMEKSDLHPEEVGKRMIKALDILQK